jgi:hypothetical protein
MKFIPILLIVLFAACSNASSDMENSTTKENRVAKKDFEKGKVVDHVTLSNNANHSFALYLPLQYDAAKKYPVLIFFDPHGGGAFAIGHYSHLANQYNCILMGSNDSKNGMDMNATFEIANELVTEAKNIFSIDTNKMMLCGFSGGAKVALNAASQLNNITKVVYCGAALPIQNCNHPLQMLGFAGLKDMNYSEVVSFSMNNFASFVKNYCVEWNGKHEWADEKTFEQAFYFLNGETEKLHLISLTNDKIKMLKQEQNTHQAYISSFQTEDMNFWEKEISRLNQQKAKDKTGLSERLLGYISLACYSYSNRMLQQNQLNDAEKILLIYKMADPTNSDCDLFSAQLFAKQNKPTRMYISLKSAVSNGLKDWSKIENEPTFAPFLQQQEMQNLHASIK